MGTLRNWAGNVAYRAARVETPSSVAEVQAVVRGAARERLRVKALGARHSFSRVADTDGIAISLERMNGIVVLDRDRGTVTIEGGTRYGELARTLNAEGYALHNLASLPHITVAGACATGTHGSGDRNGSLPSAIVALDMVTADGSLVSLRRDENTEFDAAVVAMGMLGIITGMTLRIEPTFTVAQTVYEGVRLSVVEERLDELLRSAYSVSLFTTWGGDGEPTFQLWRKAREGDAPFHFADFGIVPADGPRHPIPGLDAAPCTEQGGVPGPWHERLPHFRFEHQPSAGAEVQAEYLVPRTHAVDAIRAVASLRERIAPLLYVCEVRSVAADPFWLSPSGGRDSLALHFTWKPDQEAVLDMLKDLEAALAPFDARPHWGKLTAMDPERLREVYPRLSEFHALRDRFDPGRVFASVGP